MANPQNAILTNLTKYQWYTHLSRTEGADLGVIKKALRDVRDAGTQTGVTTPINVCLLFGPSLLADLTDEIPADFQPYPGYRRPTARWPRAPKKSCCCGSTPTRRTSAGRRSTGSAPPSPGI